MIHVKKYDGRKDKFYIFKKTYKYFVSEKYVGLRNGTWNNIHVTFGIIIGL